MAVVVHAKAPGGAENLLLETVELPEPRPDEIRLRQTAIGVNFIDIYQRSGLYPLPDRVPGVEAAGIVTAKGSDVTGLSVGDRVAYAGGPAGAYASERIIYSGFGAIQMIEFKGLLEVRRKTLNPVNRNRLKWISEGVPAASTPFGPFC